MHKSKRLFTSALLAVFMVFSLIGGSLAVPGPGQALIEGPPFKLEVTITAPSDNARFTACNYFEVVARVKNEPAEMVELSGEGEVEGSPPVFAYCVALTLEIDGPASTKEPLTKQVTKDEVCESLGPGESATVKWKLHCDGQGDVDITVTPTGFLFCCGECSSPMPCEALESDTITVRQFAAPAPQPRASACSAAMPGSVCCSPKTLRVSPEVASAGQPVTIAASIGNDGDADTAYSAVLAINGQVEETRTVNISPHGACPVSFTVCKNQPGTYTVDLGGSQASFTIVGDAAGSPMGNSGGLIAILILALLVVATGIVLALAFRKRPA